MATNPDITESERYSREAAAIQSDARRFDEINESICWDISTCPESFPLIEGTRLRVVKTRAGLGGCPALRILFTIDSDDNRTLHSVETLEDQTPDPRTLFHD
jgi:hypothetical protein